MRSKGPGYLLIELKEIFDLLLEHVTNSLISILAVLHKQGAVSCFIRNSEVSEWDNISSSVKPENGS